MGSAGTARSEGDVDTGVSASAFAVTNAAAYPQLDRQLSMIATKGMVHARVIQAPLKLGDLLPSVVET